MRKVAARYGLLGRVLEVTTNEPWCAELLTSAYDMLRAPAKAEVDHTASLMRESCGQLHLRYDGRELPYPDALEEEPFKASASAVETLFSHFASHASGHLAIRATTIASRDGAVMLVGPRGIGTSLLALHLVHRGAQFLGDDLALVNTESRSVTSVPRRPSLREGSLRFIPTRELRESVNAARYVYRTKGGRLWYSLHGVDLGGHVPSFAVRSVRAVVVVARRNTERCGVVQIPPDDALSAMLNYGLVKWQTLTHLTSLRTMLDDTVCFELNLSGPGESARLLTKALIARA